MFRLLQWVLILGAFAGLGLRASGAHFDDARPEAHAQACCDHGDEAEAPLHGPDCPPVPHQHGSHHHHGECCHAPQWLPLTAQVALFPPLARAVDREEANERPPDGPVLPFDKPPLI